MIVTENSRENGMPRPTTTPLRKPITATTSTITSTSAVRMLPSSSRTCSSANSAWFCDTTSSMPAGREARAASTIATTSPTLSMTLALARFFTAMAIASRPL